MLELSLAIEREQGAAAALEFLQDYRAGQADRAGAERLLELRLARLPEQAGSGDEQLLDAVRHLVAVQPAYRCEHCGFEARTLHWQCPSCKHWGSVKAVAPPPLNPPNGIAPQRSAVGAGG